MTGNSPTLTGLMLWIFLSTPYQVDLLVCDRTNTSIPWETTEKRPCRDYSQLSGYGYIIKTKDGKAIGLPHKNRTKFEDFIQHQRENSTKNCLFTIERTKRSLTCHNIGRSYYRTFDNFEYKFAGNSTYTLAESTTWHIKVTLKNCDHLTACQKLVKINFDYGDTVETDGRNIAVNEQNITVISGKSVSTPRQSCKISAIDDFIEIVCKEGVSVTVDVASTVCVTLDDIESGGGQVSGLCGNNNGNPGILDEFGGTNDTEKFVNCFKTRR